jgi:hypothetical protein
MQSRVVADWFKQICSNEKSRAVPRWIQRCDLATLVRSIPDGDFPVRIRGTFFQRAALMVVAVSALFTPLAPTRAGQNVTLAWNPDSNISVAGYRLYYGVGSRNYTNVVDAGKAAGVTVSNLVGGVTYYFATTAYNIIGLESVPSLEISYAPPLPSLLRLQIRITSGTNLILYGTGLAGHTYQIQASTNLAIWGSFAMVTAGSDGSFQFTNSGLGNYSRRFFRTLDTHP